VARSVGAIAEPVSQVVRAVVAPLTGITAAVVEPVLRPLEPVVSAVTRPVAGIVRPVTSVVQPVTAPILGAPPPLRSTHLTLLTSRAGRPVLAEVSQVTALSVADPGSSSGPAATLRPESAVPPARPGHVCAGKATPHRSAVRSEALPRRDAPGDTPAPVRPAPCDVASGSGSGVPAAFLAGGHSIPGFRAATWAHGDFVPLWRACEPGTGPG
jgi:hypothetical protein